MPTLQRVFFTGTCGALLPALLALASCSNRSPVGFRVSYTVMLADPQFASIRHSGSSCEDPTQLHSTSVDHIHFVDNDFGVTVETTHQGRSGVHMVQVIAREPADKGRILFEKSYSRDFSAAGREEAFDVVYQGHTIHFTARGVPTGAKCPAPEH